MVYCVDKRHGCVVRSNRSSIDNNGGFLGLTPAIVMNEFTSKADKRVAKLQRKRKQDGDDEEDGKTALVDPNKVDAMLPVPFLVNQSSLDQHGR